MHVLGIVFVACLAVVLLGLAVIVKGRVSGGRSAVTYHDAYTGQEVGPDEHRLHPQFVEERRERKEVPVRWAGAVLVVAGSAIAFACCIRVVPANTVGIPVTFGKVGSPIGSGIHVVNPFTEVSGFSTRIQELSMLKATPERKKDDSISVISKGGGAMQVDLTVRYFVEQGAGSKLFRQAGSMDLVRDRFVRPDAREVTRNVFAQFSAEEGYSAKRAEITQQIHDELAPRLAVRGILLDSVNLREVAPAQQILDQINAVQTTRSEAQRALEDQKKQVTEAETRKQVAERDAQAKVTAATGEAEATRIAADAQADANRAVAASITPEFIDYQRALALSQAQTIYVPAGGNVLIGAAP